MTSHTVGSTLSHDAMFYGGDDEFADALVPFVRDGVYAGQAVVAAVTGPNIGVLRDALGGDAAAVTFIDRDEWYRRPATTVAGWRRLLDEALDQGKPFVRIIGEVAFGPHERHPTWTRYEAALNLLFAAAPAWIVCPYDTRTLPAQVVADARRTHPTEYGPTRRGSDHYVDPEQLLRTIREPLPPARGRPVAEVALRDTGDLATARSAVRAAAAGWPVERLEEVLLAVTEIAGNALRHGRGERLLRLWHDRGALVCEVTDEGPGLSDPLAGYAPPAPELTPGGWGLWIAHQLCDAVAADRQDGRTRVRLAATPSRL